MVDYLSLSDALVILHDPGRAQPTYEASQAGLK